MPIRLVCRCGARLKARDGRAGVVVNCPQCGGPLTIPNSPVSSLSRDCSGEPISTGASSNQETLPEQDRRSRPIYQDPIVVVGTVVPLTILAMFFGYLAWQRSVDHHRARVHQARLEADELVANGETAEALRRYEALLAFAGDRSDELSRQDVELARRARDRIVSIAAEERARDEASRAREVNLGRQFTQMHISYKQAEERRQGIEDGTLDVCQRGHVQQVSDSSTGLNPRCKSCGIPLVRASEDLPSQEPEHREKWLAAHDAAQQLEEKRKAEALAMLDKLLVEQTARERSRQARISAVEIASATELDRRVSETLDRYGRAVDKLNEERSDTGFQRAMEEVNALKARFYGTLDEALRPHHNLLVEATTLFDTEYHEIGLIARSTRKILEDEGLATDMSLFLKGGILLLRNSHYSGRGQPGAKLGKPKFGEYSYLYSMWRREGLSHTETIKRLYDYQKF